MRRRTRVVDPGDVIIETWDCTKGRPWLVLWVDDVLGQVCVVAVTSQTGYTGAVYTGHKEFRTAGAWVMIQPLHRANRAQLVGNFNKQQRQRVAKRLARNLAILDD